MAVMHERHRPRAGSLSPWVGARRGERGRPPAGAGGDRAAPPARLRRCRRGAQLRAGGRAPLHHPAGAQPADPHARATARLHTAAALDASRRADRRRRRTPRSGPPDPARGRCHRVDRAVRRRRTRRADGATLGAAGPSGGDRRRPPRAAHGVREDARDLRATSGGDGDADERQRRTVAHGRTAARRRAAADASARRQLLPRIGVRLPATGGRARPRGRRRRARPRLPARARAPVPRRDRRRGGRVRVDARSRGHRRRDRLLRRFLGRRARRLRPAHPRCGADCHSRAAPSSCARGWTSRWPCRTT